MSEVKIIDKYIECVSICINNLNLLKLKDNVENICQKKCNDIKKIKNDIKKIKNDKILNEKFPEDLYK